MRLAIESASLSQLHRAAFEADVPRLERLLAGGGDPNEPGCVRDESDGWRSNPGPSYIATPLMLAAASSSRNAPAAIRTLLDAGADPRARSTRGDPALWFAASAGNIGGMQALLEGAAPPDLPTAHGVTAICEAAATRSVNCVRLLLHAGASPHPVAKDQQENPIEPTHSFRIPLFAAAAGGSADCVHLLIQAGARVNTLDISGATPLMYASTAEVVRTLVAAGCPVNARETPPGSVGAIDHAAENGHREALFALVEAGADIEARTESGPTALIHYCRSDNIRSEMVHALIEAGADVHATWGHGRTALHEAVECISGGRHDKLRDVIIALVEAGIDVNVRDDALSTPLHYAVDVDGEIFAVPTLIELGANPNLKNDRGNTALDLAPSYMRWQMTRE